MGKAGCRIVGKLPGQSLALGLNEASKRAAAEMAAEAVSQVKESLMSDRDSRGFVGRYDTGSAHQHVFASALRRGVHGWYSTVGIGPPRDEISGVLEKGRRKGQPMPPVDALVPWVRRNLGNRIAGEMKGAKVTEKAAARQTRREAILARKGLKFARGSGAKVSGVSRASLERRIRSVAFLVARSISEKGTPGLGMFAKAARYLRSRSAAILRSAIHRTLAERRGSRR